MPVAAITAMLGLVAIAYLPGLSGPYVFDDYANLGVLGAFGPVDDWRTLLFYLTSGNADPTGRPIALLTFLFDAQAWPADPWPFKRTNLLLHLLNTALLAVVVARLQAGLRRRNPDIALSPWTPALAAMLWGAHPFFVSTTLYVVQREAMLPMPFVLLAILAWDRALQSFAAGHRRAGSAWGLLGVGGATLLATFSKANGALAPLLVGIAHVCCLGPPPGIRDNAAATVRRAATACLLLPTLLLVAYLLQVGWQLWALTEVPGRDWSLPQRLLSQPRALWSYLAQLAMPRAGGGGGVYVEGFAASTGWLRPATTLPAGVALLASIALAIRLRRRFPIAAFAWLFFLGGHLLESTTVPLELYFEHRNYLPAMFLGWPLAHALLRPGMYVRGRLALAVAIVAGLLLLTHQRAIVWGDEALLASVSAAHSPGSARSQIEAAQLEIERGDTRTGLARIAAVQRAHPRLVEAAVNAVGMECAATGSLAGDTLAAARRTLATTRRWNYGLYVWLQRAAEDTGLRGCRGFGPQGLAQLLDALESNPLSRDPARQRDVLHVRGRMALAGGGTRAGAAWFERALRAKPDAEYALVQAAALGEAGAPALGVAHLDAFARLDAGQETPPVRDMAGLHRRLLDHYGYYRAELAHLRGRMQADADRPRAVRAQ